MSLKSIDVSNMTQEQQDYWRKNFIPYGSTVKMKLSDKARIPTWTEKSIQEYSDIYRFFKDRQDGKGTLMEISFFYDDNNEMVMLASVGFNSTFAFYDMELEIEYIK